MHDARYIYISKGLKSPSSPSSYSSSWNSSIWRQSFSKRKGATSSLLWLDFLSFISITEIIFSLIQSSTISPPTPWDCKPRREQHSPWKPESLDEKIRPAIVFARSGAWLRIWQWKAPGSDSTHQQEYAK